MIYQAWPTLKSQGWGAQRELPKFASCSTCLRMMMWGSMSTHIGELLQLKLVMCILSATVLRSFMLFLRINVKLNPYITCNLYCCLFCASKFEFIKFVSLMVTTLTELFWLYYYSICNWMLFVFLFAARIYLNNIFMQLCIELFSWHHSFWKISKN